MLIATDLLLLLFPVFFSFTHHHPRTPLPASHHLPTSRPSPSSHTPSQTFLPIVPTLTAATHMASLRRRTYTYKQLRGVELKADAYLPRDEVYEAKRGKREGVPVMVYYHGVRSLSQTKDPSLGTDAFSAFLSPLLLLSTQIATSKGGMCAGNRDYNDWVAKWLFRGLLEEGWVVVGLFPLDFFPFGG
jgi:hypothetical protein